MPVNDFFEDLKNENNDYSYQFSDESEEGK